MPKHYIPEFFAKAPRPLNQLGVNKHCLQRIGFLLVPDFTYIGFASAIEPLRMVNMIATKPCFEAVTVSADGDAVAASNGVCTQVDYALVNLPKVDTLIICGPNPIDFCDEKRLIHFLQDLAQQGVILGAIDTGSYLLARAGLLDGYRCTIHWQDMESMLLTFPKLVITRQIFEIDRDRLTSGGGTSAMDMMLQFIRQTARDEHFAAPAADLLVHDRIRTNREIQRVPLRQRLGTTQPKLRDAVYIMEANIEQPLSLSELAVHTKLSERQLGRLFREKLDCTPNEYYMQLRLNIARTRLLYSEEPVMEVAHSCGFSSNSYFTKCYKQFFGVTPSVERSGGL